MSKNDLRVKTADPIGGVFILQKRDQTLRIREYVDSTIEQKGEPSFYMDRAI